MGQFNGRGRDDGGGTPRRAEDNDSGSQQQQSGSSAASPWPSVSNKDIAEALLRAIRKASRDAKLSARVFPFSSGDPSPFAAGEGHGYHPSSGASSCSMEDLVAARIRMLKQVGYGRA